MSQIDLSGWGSLLGGVAALLGALGTLVVALRRRPAHQRLWRKWLRRRARRKMIDAEWLFNMTAVLLAKYQNNYGALRALFISVQNGTGDWSDLKIIAEANRENVPRVFQRWNHWDPDPPYRQMLGRLLQAEDRGILLITSQMEDGELRDYYRAQGVCASIVVRVSTTSDGRLVYVSLNFGSVQQPEGANPECAGDPTMDCRESVDQAERLFQQGEPIIKMQREFLQYWQDE